MFRVGSIYGYIGETGRIILEVIGRDNDTITVIENGARRRELPVTFDRCEERAEVWEYMGVHGYIYADRDAAHEWSCGPNSGTDYKDKWYAVRKDGFDTNFETGNYKYTRALDMLKKHGGGLISVIDDIGRCIGEIDYKDLI